MINREFVSANDISSYVDLVLRVFKINPAAGQYLADEVLSSPVEVDLCGAISSVFIWEETKQGHDYWLRIARQLNEVD